MTPVPESPHPESSHPESPHLGRDHDRLSRSELFGGFFVAGLSGFGGVLPFARRLLVERRGWLSEAEFADLFSLCQFLPGPNIVNLAAAFGARHRGVSGALAALTGLLTAPIVIVVTLGLLFERFGTLRVVHHGLEGLAAAASGLILATAIKIAVPSLRVASSLAIVVLAFGLFAVGHLKLPAVLAIALPISLILAARRIR